MWPFEQRAQLTGEDTKRVEKKENAAVCVL